MSDGQPTHLDLFSGIGGFALAAQWAGFRTIGFCEIDKWCRKVLAKNFLADSAGAQCNGSTGKGMPSTRRPSIRLSSSCPIIGDIWDLDGRDFADVTLITGGFPCQPFSCAGKRRGKEDDRHLWPEMLRVVAEARPLFILAENVAGIINMELDTVLSDLEAIGYATRAFVIPACGVDAPHRRNRVWIVGYADNGGIRRTGTQGNEGHLAQSGQDVADADREGSQGYGRLRERGGQRTIGSCCWPDESEWESQSRLGGSIPDGVSQWMDEPPIPRVARGVKERVNRLKGLGNAIVPQVAYQILKVIYDQTTKNRENRPTVQGGRML